MSRRSAYRFFAVLLVVALACPLVPAYGQDEAPATREEYAERVALAREAVDDAAGELMDSRAGSDLAAEIYRLLPAREKVDMGDGLVVDVDNSTLRSLLTELDAADTAGDRADKVEELAAHLGTLQYAVGEPGDDVVQDAELLEEILEGQRPQENEALQRWLAEMMRRLDEWLSSLFESEAGQTSATVIDWVTRGLIVVLALILAYVLFRVLVRLRKTAQDKDLSIAEASTVPVVAAAEGLPDDVLALADDLAARGLHREAVRALYGGAARAIVEAGLVGQARTLTTRELLATLTSAPSDVRDLLDDLTDVFEVAWYGHRDPGAEGFAQARADHVRITDRVGRVDSGGDE